MTSYKSSEKPKKSHILFSTADSQVSSSSENSNLYTSEEVAPMASFSIEGLLGLGKDNGQINRVNGAASNKSEGVSAEQAKGAKSTSKDATMNGKPTQDKHVNGGPSTAAVNDTDEAKETLHESEQEDNTELVTVEVTTMHASSISRSSSRKRKRTTAGKQSYKAEQRDSTPESDAEPVSPGYNAEERNSKSSASKRLRTAFSTAQLRALEVSFRICPYPDSYGREHIARLTGIDESKIQVWFQNRRARYRKREKPMESQKSSGAAQSSTASPFSHHSMMQAYFTAAALQPGAKPPTTPGPSPQQFYAPGSPFFATGFATMPAAAAYPPPGYYPFPGATPSPMDLMAAAAQIHANKSSQENSEEGQ